MRGSADVGTRKMRLAGAGVSDSGRRHGAPGGALRPTSPCLVVRAAVVGLATAEVTDGSFRALSFSVISRAHCAMHQVLQVPHEQFLVRLFALLERPDLAASMAHTPPCVMDVWTQEMLR